MRVGRGNEAEPLFDISCIISSILGRTKTVKRPITRAAIERTTTG